MVAYRTSAIMATGDILGGKVGRNATWFWVPRRCGLLLPLSNMCKQSTNLSQVYSIVSVLLVCLTRQRG